MTIEYHHPLDGSEELRYGGEALSFDRVYFPRGFSNQPVRVWVGDESEIHYRSDTLQLLALNLETGTQTFAEIDGRDGDDLLLKDER